MNRFEGQVAVVTGAGTGIGAAVACRLADEGAKVVLVGRRLEPLKNVAKMCNGHVFQGDAAVKSDMDACIAETHEKFGDVSVLVCSAGGFGFGSLGEITDDEWAKSVTANLNTAMVAARSCMPDLIKTKGNVLLISSIAGLAAGPEACGYVSMKHAAIGLARSIARDYGKHGVRSNTICPGWVRTEMGDFEMKELVDRQGLDGVEDAYNLVTKDVPLQKPAEPEDVANAVAFLCSNEAKMITGATLTIDGGATIVDVPTIAFDA